MDAGGGRGLWSHFQRQEGLGAGEALSQAAQGKLVQPWCPRAQLPPCHPWYLSPTTPQVCSATVALTDNSASFYSPASTSRQGRAGAANSLAAKASGRKQR